MENYTSTVGDFPAHIFNQINYDIKKLQVNRALKIYIQLLCLIDKHFQITNQVQ